LRLVSRTARLDTVRATDVRTALRSALSGQSRQTPLSQQNRRIVSLPEIFLLAIASDCGRLTAHSETGSSPTAGEGHGLPCGARKTRA
jgi:hypothetical protein